MIWGSIPGSSNRVFPSPKYLYKLWGPSGLLLNWYWGFFLGEKWLECEPDHSLSSSGSIKNEWSYISTTPSCCNIVYRVCK